MHILHKEILQEIKKQAGKATQDTFLNSYLGNSHPRYAISAPVLRNIAKNFMAGHKDLSANELAEIISSLIEGSSFTEKCMGGILTDYAKAPQRKFNIKHFDKWLDHVEGWAEIDSLCTGKYALQEIPANFEEWKPFLKKLARSKRIEKRRASLVFLTSPISHCDDDNVGDTALELIDSLKKEKEILITKAISWLLRSMIKHHRRKVENYLKEHSASLPAIAVRETSTKLKTGIKTQRHE